MITAGVDVGAGYVKVVVLDDGKVAGRGKGPVGFDVLKSTADVFKATLDNIPLSRDDVEKVAVTGMGKDAVLHKPPLNAEIAIPVVVADARGAFHLLPTVRTVIDVGAEEARAIKVRNGEVVDFAVNERCAAGAGVFLETMARALEVGLEDMGPLSLKSTRTIAMNAQCAVFAESEVVTLIHSKGVTKADIAKAIHDAMASRVGAIVLRVGVEKDVALIGGVANNCGFLESLKRELKTDIIVPSFPEYVGALGAALIAQMQRGE